MDKLGLTYKFFKMFFLYINLGDVEYLNKLPSLFMDHSCMYRNNFVIKFNVMLVEIE